jgi:hypothetical protein
MQLRGLSGDTLESETVVAAHGCPSRRNPAEMRAERLTIAGETYGLR